MVLLFDLVWFAFRRGWFGFVLETTISKHGHALEELSHAGPTAGRGESACSYV